jgi:hypothetical protein
MRVIKGLVNYFGPYVGIGTFLWIFLYICWTLNGSVTHLETGVIVSNYHCFIISGIYAFLNMVFCIFLEFTCVLLYSIYITIKEYRLNKENYTHESN